MSVTKLHKEEIGFVQISNETISLITDPAALGIYCYLFSKPSDWVIVGKQVQKHFGIGKDKYQSCMRVLRELGLVKLTRDHHDGKITGSTYHIYATPREPDNQSVGKSAQPESRISPQPEIHAARKSGCITNKELLQTNISTNKEWVPPSWLNLDAWQEFEQHRSSSAKLKRGWTDLARTKAANQLEGLTHQEQQQLIDYSIQGGYPALYPDRLTRQSSQPKPKTKLQRAAEALGYEHPTISPSRPASINHAPARLLTSS